MAKKPKVQKKLDCTDLNSQISRIYSDLSRLEPLRRAMGVGKSLDMMFIIDCTGWVPGSILASRKLKQSSIVSATSTSISRYASLSLRTEITAMGSLSQRSLALATILPLARSS
jgi:hypothetical protein